MTAHLTHLCAAMVALRVFVPDGARLVRRLAAAGVRLGTSELLRPGNAPGEHDR